MLFEHVGPDKLKIHSNKNNLDKKLNRKNKKESFEEIEKIGNFDEVYWDEAYGRAIVATNKKGTFEHSKEKFFEKTGWIMDIKKPSYSGTVSKVRELIYDAEGRYEFLKEVSRNVNRSVDNSWGRLTFLGGSKEVGRNSILLQTPSSNVLLDHGIGMESSQTPYMPPELCLDELDAIMLTHAHLDHSGNIANLYSKGYDGALYATEPTLSLIRLLKKDFYRISRENSKTLFSKSDIDTMLKHSLPIRYGNSKEISPGVEATFIDAGHLPGSSGILLSIDGKNIFYTGDFDNRNTPLLSSCDFFDLPELDVLVMESTYAFEDIPSQKSVEDDLVEIVKKTLNRGGIPVISTFAVGRAQEVLSLLNNHDLSNRVYVDGMIRESTKIMRSYPEYIKPRLNFDINWIYSDEDRVEAIENDGIILTTSGMLTGGAVTYYLQKLGEDKKNSLILPGYMAENTPGRRAIKGAEKIEIGNTLLKLNLEVYHLRFSGHSDRSGIWNFIHNINGSPETFIVHGECKNCKKLAEEIKMKMGWDAKAPQNLDSFRLF